GRLLQLDDVLRGRALLALDHVELDPLALGQALEALGLDGRMVDEAVLLTALGRDETEALGVVEPFDRSGSAHCPAPCTVCNRRWGHAARPTTVCVGSASTRGSAAAAQHCARNDSQNKRGRRQRQPLTDHVSSDAPRYPHEASELT